GRVWLQSLPFSRLAGRVLAYAPQAGGKNRGEGSILGGIGGLLDGDNS
ncbi:MAG: TIGR00266 family protein, partial [Verrucomicrobia bacterium]|nr:TIGR00266 family protein [Verrucomicrobiota bacterium]